MAKTPRTTLAWPVLHNFTPAVESLSQEMYFLLTPAWFVPRWRRQHSMPPIVPSSNPTGDGKASVKALPQTQSQPMSEKNIHDFPYVHRPFFRQRTSLRLLPPLLWARRQWGNRGSHGHLPVTPIPAPSHQNFHTKKSDGRLLHKHRALPPPASARMAKAWLAPWSGTGMMH